MKRFTSLFSELDRTTRTGVKLDALERYFRDAPPEDACWGLSFLAGQRSRRPVTVSRLHAWIAEEAGVAPWLVGECYEAVGDFSETLALLLPDPASPRSLPLHALVAERIHPLATLDEAGQRELVVRTWRELPFAERFLFHKLIMGNFRVGVAKRLVTRALAAAAGVDPAVMAHRLMGPWTPTPAHFETILTSEADAPGPARPYPFYLASPLEAAVDALGAPGEWHAEWKWDGIRAQLIRRAGEVVVWSRGEDMIGASFPELVAIGAGLPDGTVIDGEVMAWEDDAPLPFQVLQRRIGRKSVEPMLFADVPIAFLAFDLLESGGADWRERPLEERRAGLGALVDTLADPRLRLSEPIVFDAWADCRRRFDQARERATEGLVLKRRGSPYRVGRPRGDWWKWKVDPLTVDAVLIYAQPGSGRRASLYTDYTFGLWEDGELVPVAKAYSGLTDEEIRAVDRHVRQTTLERKGPVRIVKPELVFELAFEGIQESGRHKAGLALRFPRMNRWRTDKKPEDADTLATLRRLLG